MQKNSNRIQERTKIDFVIKFLNENAYLETLIIVSLYLTFGYIISPSDICLLDGQISYILILLSIITLFHGFENGMMAIGIIAVAMWYFYEYFQYIEFLATLVMTMIFSEFHYYWTKKIKEAEISSNYKSTKLDELSKAFYTLKISHDQLEKNYVVKPMSIRNSIEHILIKNKSIPKDATVAEKSSSYYYNFLELLEKSFNVKSSLIVYRDDTNKTFDKLNANLVLGTGLDNENLSDIFKDYLVDKAINKQKPIYISDENGDPASKNAIESNFIAAIPSIQDSTVVSILIIKKMPFMAFNRENLTSIAILLEYFSIELKQKNTLAELDEIKIIKDPKFRYEYARLKQLYLKYKVDSILLVLRIDNELQARRIYERIQKMVRSLDMVTKLELNDLYYITLMFPLHDNSAALGYLNRLINSLDEEKDKEFHHMTFNFSQTKLFNKYLREDYDK